MKKDILHILATLVLFILAWLFIYVAFENRIGTFWHFFGIINGIMLKMGAAFSAVVFYEKKVTK